MASNIFLKRKTRKVPFMFPRRKFVRSIISANITDSVKLECVRCVNEPICKFS